MSPNLDVPGWKFTGAQVKKKKKAAAARVEGLVG